VRKVFAELRRRNVVRVGIAYLVVGWLALQVAETIFPTFGAPAWVLKVFIALLALGFPFALLFAWAFELTPEGVKKTRDVDRSESVTHSTGRKLDFVIIAALVVALGYFIWDRQNLTRETPETAADTDTSAGQQAEKSGPIERSIAVLPFLNMSSDEEQQWFADGLTEEVLNSLARTPDLLVASRTSSFGYKGSSEDVRMIAQALGVAHILEGSVRRSKERIRVTAQLIRAGDGFHLWSQTYDRKPDDVIEIQEDLAIQIARALKTAMDPEALERMMSAGTASVAAYEAYLEGTAALNGSVDSGDKYEFQQARQAFEQAIELDPEFALAYRNLALYWAIQLEPTNIYSPTTGDPDAGLQTGYREAMDSAIRLEQDPVRKVSYRADQAMNELRFADALKLNSEYLEQRPFDRDAQTNQLAMLSALGRWAEAEQAVFQYFEQDGYDPVIANSLILALLYSGNEKALEEITQQTLSRFSGNINVVYQAHRALLWLGKVDEASRLVAQIETSQLDDDNKLLVAMRQACAENRRVDAMRLLETAERQFADRRSIMWLSHMIAGQKDKAYEYVRPYDDNNDMRSMWAFYGYGTFDATRFPNLMAMLADQGIEPHPVLEKPYRCRDTQI
jgi:TolB-like protein/Flp pilus assembly protein TadD